MCYQSVISLASIAPSHSFASVLRSVEMRTRAWWMVTPSRQPVHVVDVLHLLHALLLMALGMHLTPITGVLTGDVALLVVGEPHRLLFPVALQCLGDNQVALFVHRVPHVLLPLLLDGVLVRLVEVGGVALAAVSCEALRELLLGKVAVELAVLPRHDPPAQQVDVRQREPPPQFLVVDELLGEVVDIFLREAVVYMQPRVHVDEQHLDYPVHTPAACLPLQFGELGLRRHLHHLRHVSHPARCPDRCLQGRT